jgi:hypothetical protein
MEHSLLLLLGDVGVLVLRVFAIFITQSPFSFFPFSSFKFTHISNTFPAYQVNQKRIPSFAKPNKHQSNNQSIHRPTNQSQTTMVNNQNPILPIYEPIPAAAATQQIEQRTVAKYRSICHVIIGFIMISSIVGFTAFVRSTCFETQSENIHPHLLADYRDPNDPIDPVANRGYVAGMFAGAGVLPVIVEPHAATHVALWTALSALIGAQYGHHNRDQVPSIADMQRFLADIESAATQKIAQQRTQQRKKEDKELIEFLHKHIARRIEEQEQTEKEDMIARFKKKQIQAQLEVPQTEE